MNQVRGLRFGFSPCPNDTFAFHALAHGLVEAAGFSITPFLADVEELNQRALSAELEVSKLSFHALGRVRDDYALLRAGSALGRGCGPLLVAKPGVSLDEALDGKVAVPGRLTTAHLLLTLFMGRPPQAEPMLFSQVMEDVAQGKAKAGLIIHEGRFTFQGYGLASLMDLGQWWEEKTGLPLPLGCIAARRDLGPQGAAALDAALRASVEKAWKEPGLSREYIAAHAQEMSPEVTRSHIDLYVNEYTADLGEEGLKAVELMMDWGAQAGLIPASIKPLCV